MIDNPLCGKDGTGAYAEAVGGVEEQRWGWVRRGEAAARVWGLV